MAKFSARVALFDNSEAQLDNEDSPAMTGKMEISETQIELLMDELLNGEVQTYGSRRYKVIDLAVWENEGGTKLKYSGKARMPRPSSKKKAKADEPAPVDSAPAVATDVHGNPVEDF